jgi:hypothetical protein
MTQTTSWGDVTAPATGSSKDIVRIDFKNVTEIKVRLLGGVLPRYVYWVVTKEGKKRSIECLSFNRETKAFDPNLPDPIKEVAPEILGEAGKPQFSYAAQLINRQTGQIALFDPIKKQAYDELVALAKNPEYGNPADPVKGYDVTISKVRTGPLPQNVKYKVQPSRENSPLTDKEKELELYDLDKILKRPTYEEQKKWLIENTLYFMPAAGKEGTVEGAKDL